MPDEPKPESDPNPMQDPDVQSVFDKAMADIEDNDDLVTREIMKQTDAASVRPEPEAPAPEPEGEEKGEQEAKPDEEKPAEGEEKPAEGEAPSEDQDMTRFRKLAKEGRRIGEAHYQLNQQQQDYERQAADLQVREEAYQQNMQKFADLMEAFERDPIEAYKLRGADPKVIGQRIKRLLTDKDGVQASDEVSELRAEVKRLTEAMESRHTEIDQQQQMRAQAEAREAAHAEMKTYMSQDSAKKAFPLASRLSEDLFRQYSSGAVDYLLQNQLELSHDNVCEVIEASLEAMRSVYGDSPAPPPREAPAPEAATPTGQRSAPSIGNDSKTSGPSGPDWDTLSLGENEDDFVDKIRKEVASG
jgi:hypothetical protein